MDQVSGCGAVSSQAPEIKAVNKQALSEIGEEIGVLPDGRKVTRYAISMGKDDLGHSKFHWIYVVDGTVSVNFETKEGKHIKSNVQVIIDEKIKEK